MLSPTPPQPSTATLSPRCTRATLTAEPKPVITPQPLIAATVKGTPSGMGVTASFRTSVSPESVPMLNDRSMGCPRQSVPSAWACPRDGSITWAGRLVSHRTVSPRRHWKHSPQGMHQFNTTRSPGVTWVTPAPISRTTPAPSWPMTSGRFQESDAWSVWQMPAALISTRTSSRRGDATSISSMAKAPAPSAMAASVGIVQSRRQVASGGPFGTTMRVRCAGYSCFFAVNVAVRYSPM